MFGGKIQSFVTRTACFKILAQQRPIRAIFNILASLNPNFSTD